MFSIRITNLAYGINNGLLYHPLQENLAILSGVLMQEMNQADNFTFSLPSTHPYFHYLDKLDTDIRLYDNNFLLFKGRVLNDDINIWNIKTVVCESCLAYLADSIVRPYKWDSGDPEAYLSFLLSQHNSQVNSNRQISLGTVTVTDPNTDIYRYNKNYPLTIQEVQDQLCKKMGGFLTITYDGNENPILNYLEDINFQSLQTIELGSNILDLKLNRKGEDITTALIPLGSTVPVDVFDPALYPIDNSSLFTIQSDGSEYLISNLNADFFTINPVDDSLIENPRVTIESVNNGIDYIFNQDAVNKFGWIFKTVVWDDIDNPTALLQVANEKLLQNLTEIASLEINAVDLSKAGQSIDNFRFMEYVNISSSANGITGKLLIIKLQTDILNPANGVLTVGSDYGRFTYDGIKDNNDRVKEEIITEIQDSEKTINIYDQIKQLMSVIQQTAESIRMEVSAIYTTRDEFGQYQREVSTQFTQLNDTFDFTFKNIIEIITDIDGELLGQFQEIYKYIRFVDGEIWLGEQGNPMQVRITHDRISFLDNGIEVAYLSNNQLHVLDGDFINSLQIGNFGFLPRNNGNLSFLKIV